MDQDSSLTDVRLRMHRNRIQSQLSSAAINLCRQIAFSFHARLPVLLSTPNGETRLLQESRSAIEQRGFEIGKTAVEDLILMIMMLAVKDASQDMKDLMQEMNEMREQKKKNREKMTALLTRLVDEAEGRRLKRPPR